ncbi:CDP-glycerol glycerophosphotransferase family protein [Brochothrix campestris]|uniref:CDP-glycerol glycerophosphotransferase family protein n=1 Tax=Brochothrix campestris TaxID=2757 RepID=UPI0038D024F9
MGKLLTISKICVKQIIRGCVGLLYKVLTLFPLKQKAVFISTRSTGASENLTPLIEELQRRTITLRIVEYNGKIATNLTQLIKTPIFFMKMLYQLATARYIVIDDYCLPVYLVEKRQGVEVIQVWHAAGALKKFGHSLKQIPTTTLQQYEQALISTHSNYDKAIVSSPAAIPAFAEAFQMPPENVLALGTPKTDVLLNPEFKATSIAKCDRFFKKINEATKRVVYAPTFREINRKRERFTLPFKNIAALYASLEQNNLILIVQLHPYNQKQWQVPQEYRKRLQLNRSHMTTSELLVASDALITDYSSILFDYSLLAKPMAFFMPDIERYQSERGFYDDILEKLPGEILQTEAALCEWLSKCDVEVASHVVSFKEKWFAETPGKASVNTIDYLLRQKTEDNLLKGE